MVLVLVLGDLHIPYRCHDLPAKFKKLLVPGKIQQILLTGNVCDKETFEYLRGVAPDVRGVKGDWDVGVNWPSSLVVEHGALRIGLLHGHQIVPPGDNDILNATARSMDVDVLITGGTHRFDAFEHANRFFINPGSATGAFTASTSPPLNTGEGSETKEQPQSTPTFCLMDLQDYNITTYVYSLVNDEVKVEKLEARLRGGDE